MSKKAIILSLISLLSILFFGGCKTEEPEVPRQEVSSAIDPDFLGMDNGLRIIEETYQFQFDIIYEMTVGLTHEALYRGDVDVGIGYPTDGKIKELNLIQLEDDQNVFPANNPALVVHKEVLEMYPQLGEIMKEIIKRLDANTMVALNYKTDLQKKNPHDVARTWLLENNFMEQEERIVTSENRIIMGTTLFKEHQLLTNLTIIALENAGIPIQEKTYLLKKPQTQRTELLADQIHMYWEYLSEGLQHLFEEEMIVTDAQKAFEILTQEDAVNDIVWLQYAPYNSNYTFIMRREHAQELGIFTFSDLAEWITRVQKKEE